VIDNATLAKLELFEGQPQEVLQAIGALCHESAFDKGTFIFAMGQPANRIYLLLEGTVRLSISATALPEPVTITLLQTPGQAFGWSAIIGSGHYTTAAQATTDVRVITLDGQALMNYLIENPCTGFEVVRRVAQVMSQRLGAMRKLLLETVIDYEKPAQATAEN
jgi:CRP-like cAMP-binding protein